MEITHLINNIINSGKELSFMYTRSHSGIGVNCVIDEIINASWTNCQINHLCIPISPKSHTETIEAIKRLIEDSEFRTRKIL